MTDPVKGIMALVLILILPASRTIAQSADSVLQKIARLQSGGGGFYSRGLFSSTRSGGIDGGVADDNNIFFTAAIAFTLQSLEGSLQPGEKALADTIIARAVSNYRYYRNRDGGITYNFWRTDPEQFFPNSAYFSKKNKYKLPDDMDGTSIIYLSSSKGRQTDSLLKAKMGQHTNLYKKKIRSIPRRYRKFKAYNTWFGKNMKLEFDISVMSNVLMFGFVKGLPVNEYDEQTIELIKQVIRTGDHRKHPYIVSPSYQETPVILYHLSRLISCAPKGIFDDVKPIVIKDLRDGLARAKSQMDKIIFSSSLYRLHERPETKIDFALLEKEFASFVFFRANLISTGGIWTKRLFGKIGFLNLWFHCEAYNRTLLLEYIELSTRN